MTGLRSLLWWCARWPPPFPDPHLLRFTSESAPVMDPRISGGVSSRRASIPSGEAELTMHRPTADLFFIRWQGERLPGVQARLGYYLSRTISIEAGCASKPKLSTSVGETPSRRPTKRADAEPLRVRRVDGLSSRRRVVRRWRGVPFFSGGAGYLRSCTKGTARRDRQRVPRDRRHQILVRERQAPAGPARRSGHHVTGEGVR